MRGRVNSEGEEGCVAWETWSCRPNNVHIKNPARLEGGFDVCACVCVWGGGGWGGGGRGGGGGETSISLVSLTVL